MNEGSSAKQPGLPPRAEVMKILLVEDEMIIAFDLCDRLEEGGFVVDGPYPSVKRALNAIESNVPDAAILDVQLTDGSVYPVADRLQELGVPLLFHSGHVDPQELQKAYPGAAICAKPCRNGTIEKNLRLLVGRPDAG